MARTCPVCGSKVPYKIKIDGRWRNIASRRYCLTCSPFGSKNRRVLESGGVDRRRSSSPRVIDWRRRTKLRAIVYKGGRCGACGYDRCPGALAFHHRDPTQKDFSITGQTRAWETIRIELDKCDLLCMNCHAEEHEKLHISGSTSGMSAGC